MIETRIHPVTGKTLTRQVRKEIVTHGAQSEEVDVPGWYPEDGSDGDGVHSGADLVEWDAASKRVREAGL